jgi:hypothetical protein
MRITVGTPYYGNWDKEHMHCVMRLNNAYPEVRTTAVEDCSYIDQAKSIIATKHMDDSDVVIVVDHDMIFEPDSILDIAESAMEKGTVVGAAYGARKRAADRPVAFCKLPVTFFEGGDIVEASVVAGGFMAIPTSMLRDMARFHCMTKAQTSLDFMAYPFFHCIVQDDKWWGEDISFCRRVHAMGLKTYIDTRIRVGHKGSYVYQVEDGIYSVPRVKSLRIEEKGT